MVELTRVRRHPERGSHERDDIYAIVDEAVYCHVGFNVDEQPFVIPTLHARVGDDLYIHGSAASRMLRTLPATKVCVTVTRFDGLVLARSIFHHSANYRSAVLFGSARKVTDEAEKVMALKAFSDKLIPGRWDDVREPAPKELRQTDILAIAIEEASAKARTGPPTDDPADVGNGAWAGVIPFLEVAGDPIPDEHVADGAPAPDYAVPGSHSRVTGESPSRNA